MKPAPTPRPTAPPFHRADADRRRCLQAALAGPDLEVSATNLLDAVLARGAPDNVSFLLIRVG